MKNIIELDYKHQTELAFTFCMPTLKALWPNQNYSDEWDLIDDICEITGYRISRPLLDHGFIIKERLSLIEKSGRTDILVLTVQFVSGLPQLDMNLIAQSLQQDRIISGLQSVTYQDRHNNTVTLLA